MRRVVSVVVGGLLCWSGVAGAQVPDWVAQVLKAAQLPVTAAQARSEGIPDTTVRAVLDAMKNANLPADEAKDMLDTARTVNREHGPVDNFGAFVKSKLDAGLRGRDLAAAIRAEHAARGKGQAKGAPGSRGNSAAKGGEKRPEDDKAAPGGKPERGDQGDRAKGKAPATKGRPDKPTR